MKNYRYIGYFKFPNKITKLEVSTLGFLSALVRLCSAMSAKSYDFNTLYKIECYDRGTLIKTKRIDMSAMLKTISDE